jgi:hypothetical protein
MSRGKSSEAIGEAKSGESHKKRIFVISVGIIIISAVCVVTLYWEIGYRKSGLAGCGKNRGPEAICRVCQRNSLLSCMKRAAEAGTYVDFHGFCVAE